MINDLEIKADISMLNNNPSQKFEIKKEQKIKNIRRKIDTNE
tara:strand:- start:288 stop:413 length:126 start_codon:yes stop_codon:yes gene_type:complete